MFITLYTVYMHICTDIGNLNEGWRNNSVSKSPIFFFSLYMGVLNHSSQITLCLGICVTTISSKYF